MDDETRRAWLSHLKDKLAVIEVALAEATADVAAAQGYQARSSLPAFECAAAPLQRALPVVRGLIDRLELHPALSAADEAEYLTCLDDLMSGLEARPHLRLA